MVEAAATCGVSRDTIKRRLRAGQFPGAHRADGSGGSGTGAWLIPWGDLLVAGLGPSAPADRQDTAGAARPAAVGVDRARTNPEDEIWQLRVARAAAESRAHALHDALELVAAALANGHRCPDCGHEQPEAACGPPRASPPPPHPS